MMQNNLTIGILALQGDFIEHITILKSVGIAAIEVRTPDDLQKADGLIIPGGESTAIITLLSLSGLDAEIIRRYVKGMPVFGSCAGAIILAKEIANSRQPRLGIMDITVQRNAYGRQIDSFNAAVDVKAVGLVRGAFIRAPVIMHVKDSVEVLGRHQETIVVARQKNLLAATFHPELVGDTKLHTYFVRMVQQSRPAQMVEQIISPE